MVMGHNCKYFSGSIPYERLAARIYDRYALQTMGLRAKTNFAYNSQELAVILDDIDTYLQEHHAKYGESRKSIELMGSFLVHSTPLKKVWLRGSLYNIKMEDIRIQYIWRRLLKIQG